MIRSSNDFMQFEAAREAGNGGYDPVENDLFSANVFRRRRLAISLGVSVPVEAEAFFVAGGCCLLTEHWSLLAESGAGLSEEFFADHMIISCWYRNLSLAAFSWQAWCSAGLMFFQRNAIVRANAAKPPDVPCEIICCRCSLKKMLYAVSGRFGLSEQTFFTEFADLVLDSDKDDMMVGRIICLG